MQFQATLELNGKTATGIHVPDTVVDALGGWRRTAVRATLNNYTYRTSLGVMGGRCLLPVSAEARAASGLQAGDCVSVTLELDNAPRELELPEDFAAALAADPAAAQAFEKQSRSEKRRLVDPIAQAKTADTRQRRFDQALSTLRAQA